MRDCERVHVLLEQFDTVKRGLKIKPPFMLSLDTPYVFR